MAKQPQSMQPFVRMWFGQLVSILGSGMTQFALAIWLWSKTGEVTPVVLTSVFFFGPSVITGPLAGVLVDRLDRKRLMLLCDFLAGCTSIVVCLLFLTNSLQVWEIYVTALLGGVFQSVQIPAVMVSVSTMVPAKGTTRALGLLSLTDNLSQIAAPALGSLLYATIHFGGILILDIVTFAFALAATLSVQIPAAPRTTVEAHHQKSLLAEYTFGFRYVLKHRNLLYLLLFVIIMNFGLMLWAPFLSPMILARTHNDAITLAWVEAAGALGAIVGGLVLARLPSPKRYFPNMLLGFGLIGVFAFPIGLNNSPFLWMVAHFSFFVLQSFGLTYHNAIWQTRVPADIQGRVFTIRRLTFSVSFLLAPMLLGNLADHVFEPAIVRPGILQNLMGRFVGTQPGDGLAAMFILGGFAVTIWMICGYFIPALRNLEQVLPSYRTQISSAVPETVAETPMLGALETA